MLDLGEDEIEDRWPFTDEANSNTSCNTCVDYRSGGCEKKDVELDVQCVKWK